MSWISAGVLLIIMCVMSVLIGSEHTHDILTSLSRPQTESWGGAHWNKLSLFFSWKCTENGASWP